MDSTRPALTMGVGGTPQGLHILQRPALLAGGCSDEAITAARRRSQWAQIRPGSYLDAGEWDKLESDERHRLLVVSTIPKLGPNTAVSHTSAARLHGLPVWPPDTEPGVVHVMRHRSSGGYRKGHVHAHVGVLEPGSTILVNGVVVTTVARTVVDCACRLPLASGVAMADAALRNELTTRSEMLEVLMHLGRRQGRSRALRVIEAADARSESVGESLSRVAMSVAGLPAPALQFEIRSDGFVARCDFAWEEFRTVGEFDGRIKYGRLLKPGEHASDVLVRERQRELAIERLGWKVARWTWDDIFRPQALATVLHATFGRGR